MEHAEIVASLTSFFEEEDLLEEPDMLTNGIDLIDSGIVDSLVLVMMVGYFEERFDFTLEPDELVEDNFRSLDNIVSFISSKMAETDVTRAV